MATTEVQTLYAVVADCWLCGWRWWSCDRDRTRAEAEAHDEMHIAELDESLDGSRDA